MKSESVRPVDRFIFAGARRKTKHYRLDAGHCPGCEVLFFSTVAGTAGGEQVFPNAVAAIPLRPDMVEREPVVFVQLAEIQRYSTHVTKEMPKLGPLLEDFPLCATNAMLSSFDCAQSTSKQILAQRWTDVEPFSNEVVKI